MRLKSQNGATQHEGKVTSQTSKSRIQEKKGGCNESDQKSIQPVLSSANNPIWVYKTRIYKITNKWDNSPVYFPDYDICHRVLRVRSSSKLPSLTHVSSLWQKFPQFSCTSICSLFPACHWLVPMVVLNSGTGGQNKQHIPTHLFYIFWDPTNLNIQAVGHSTNGGTFSQLGIAYRVQQLAGFFLAVPWEAAGSCGKVVSVCWEDLTASSQSG